MLLQLSCQLLGPLRLSVSPLSPSRCLSLSVVSAQPIRRALAGAGLVANAARFVFCRHLNSGLFNDFCNCFRERIFKIDFSERYFGFISLFRVFFLAFAFAFALPCLALLCLASL